MINIPFDKYNNKHIDKGMEELKAIIIHKLKLISQYSSVELTEEDAEKLLKEKRKESSREVIETRLLQQLATKKIDAPYRLEQFYHESLQLMKIYDLHFTHESKTEKDYFDNIVSLYVSFFHSHASERRAEELTHIYGKKLIQKNLLISLLFNWLAEWTKKVFTSFIKNTLLNFNNKKSLKKSELEKYQKERKLVIDKTINAHIQEIKYIEKQYEKKKDNIKTSELLDYSSNGLLNRDKDNRSLAVLRSYQGLESLKRLDPEERSGDAQLQQGMKSPRKNGFKTPEQKQEDQSQIVSKDLFFGAHYQEINQYYKYHQILDVDFYSLKVMKKMERKEQMKTRIKDVAKVMARGQGNIKKSIDSYCEEYYKKFPQVLEEHKRLEQKKKVKKNQKEYQKKRLSAIFVERENKKQVTARQPSIEQKATKLSNPKKTLDHEKKTIEIVLPQVLIKKQYSPYHKSPTSKILVASPLNQNSRSMVHEYLHSRISAEVGTKQLQEINSLFRKQEKISKTYSLERRSLDEGKFELSQRGHSKNSGIFYLPSIGRHL